MKATIEYEDFEFAESRKLRPFLRTARFFAERWQREVIINAPHGKTERFTTRDGKEKIYIHFYSTYPHKILMMGYAAMLFGFTVPTASMHIDGFGSGATVTGNDVGARLRDNKLYTQIRSPEGRVIAQVAENHIYITFDIAHRPWQGSQPVFWEILERATQILINKEVIPEENSPFAAFGKKLQLYNAMHDTLIQKKRIPPKSFDIFCRALLVKKYTSFRTEAHELRKKIKETERQLVASALQIEINTRLLKDPAYEKNFSKETIAEEFELIHTLKGVLGIKIVGDDLCVYTEPIRHIGDAYSAEPQRHPPVLGQYKIILNMLNLKRASNTFPEAIKIAKWGWRGPFDHPEATFKDSNEQKPGAPCFGATFVGSIEKALMDHDYATLIHLMLHYLDSDTRQATMRNAADPHPYKKTDFYTPEYAKETACDDYVAYVKKFRETIRKENIRKAIQDGCDQERNQGKACAARRQELLFIEEGALPFLERHFNLLNTKQEWEILLAMPSLIAIEAGEKFIWLAFGPGQGAGAFNKSMFLGTFRIFVDIIQGNVRVYGKRTAYPAEQDAFIGESVESDGKLNSVVFFEHLMAMGYYGQACATIYDYIRGLSFGSRENEMIRESKRALIEKFLEEKAFPPFKNPASKEWP